MGTATYNTASLGPVPDMMATYVCSTMRIEKAKRDAEVRKGEERKKM